MCFSSLAQETPVNPNPNSAHPIYEADIQYRAQIWRRMDLNEKINQPFFAENNQISKFLIPKPNVPALLHLQIWCFSLNESCK